MAHIQNLHTLVAELKAGAELDWSDLPTFGGTEPTNTQGVWSWDADNLLIGTCASDLQIVLRADWE